MARKSYPHCSKALRYARAVVNGKRTCGEFERLACWRFIRDLARDDWIFDKARAERACKFIEKLEHVKGRWARPDKDSKRAQTLKLEGWQCFIIVNIFGFVDESGLRRFVEAYIRVGRKNGKSILAAAIALYMFVEDDEWGAEIYSGATSEKQAWEVFRPARQMALREPEFVEYYGVEVNAKNMNVPSDGSRFEPIIGNPGDGSSPSLAIIDEYHEHKTPEMYNTMTTGMGAREQPLALIITTAGVDISSPCFDKDDDCKNILREIYDDDSIFAVIYAADPEDLEEGRWRNLRTMKKANPNLGISVDRKYLDRRAVKAARSPSDLSAFKTKNLNVWVGSGSTFLNTLKFQDCGDASLRIEDFIGKNCVFGVDLASRIDIVALMRCFYELDEAGKLDYWWFPSFFLPENRVKEDKTGRYEKWVESGHLHLHDDDEIDFAKLRTFIKDEAERCSPIEIAYDPWRAIGLEQELTSEGFTMVKLAQTIATFTSPMDELQAAHLSGRLKHDANPVLNWMAGNMVAKEDTNGNKKPRREVLRNKIDGMVAGLMAMNRALAQPKNGLDDWLKSIAGDNDNG